MQRWNPFFSLVWKAILWKNGGPELLNNIILITLNIKVREICKKIQERGEEKNFRGEEI